MLNLKKHKILVNPRGTALTIGITLLDNEIFVKPISLAKWPTASSWSE
jgi:hypothetical protein